MVPFIREIVIDTLNTPQYELANLEFETATEDSLHQIDEHFMRRAIMNFYTMPSFIMLLMFPYLCQLMKILLRFPIMVEGSQQRIWNIFFERYYRGTNTEKTTGTGLGTAIARDIIEAHGGTVSISSEEGKGTSVNIYLKRNT